MDAFRALCTACVIALAMLLQPSAPGHAAFEPPCHEEHAVSAEQHGQPCEDHAAASGLACCVSASCAAPAWASPASATCPQPAWRPAPAAFAQPRAGGDGVPLRPILPPPRVA